MFASHQSQVSIHHRIVRGERECLLECNHAGGKILLGKVSVGEMVMGFGKVRMRRQDFPVCRFGSFQVLHPEIEIPRLQQRFGQAFLLHRSILLARLTHPLLPAGYVLPAFGVELLHATKMRLEMPAFF